jgi:endonuclease YncB( thermonuclease family)
MKPDRAVRRHLATSPFNKPSAPEPPPEQYAVQDQVTHDRYGLGRVVTVVDGTSVTIDFGSRLVRIQTPCAKMSKL